MISAPPIVPDLPRDPCIPSPCGSNAQCYNANGSPACSCSPNFIGSPPNCRPECVINSECSSNLACINQKCRDPCPGSCGLKAVCSVHNHVPICSCLEGYTGDAFTDCRFQPLMEPIATDPCNPTPCGQNTQCNNGICSCIPEYIGDPNFGCRPECVLNNECQLDTACIRNKCADPCPGTCGQNAQCNVFNHVPMCTCLPGMAGNALVSCQPVIGIIFETFESSQLP